jgi:hypothetical protein
MPGGAIGYLTPASANIGGVDESTFYSSAVNPGYLVFGTNVLAAEIHQGSSASTDISFEFELTGVQSYIAPSFTGQPQSLTVGTGSNATFSATVLGSAPMFYQWRFNGTNIAGATNSAFGITNAQLVHSGNYALVVTNSAGAATSQVAVLTVESSDFDGDGMLDSWELSYGLSPNNPNDAHVDNDGDGMTNLQEFRAGTDPTNPLSVLRLTITALSPVQMQFTAQSNLTYSVQFNTNIGLNSWSTLSNISAKPSLRTVTVFDSNPSTNRVRFYRAVTP